jgi:hypothetical protein
LAVFEGRFTDTADLRIAVVVARFNDLVTGKLLSGCLDCLLRHGIDTSPTSSQLDVAWVPGSFEIPLVAQRLAASGRYQVVITLGAVIRGDTPHFDVVVAPGAGWHQEQSWLELRNAGAGDGQPDEGVGVRHKSHSFIGLDQKSREPLIMTYSL